MPALSAYDVTLNLSLDDTLTKGMLKAEGTFKKTTDTMAKEAKKAADAQEREAKKAADATEKEAKRAAATAAREARKKADAEETEAKRASNAREREAKRAADAEAAEARRAASAVSKAQADAATAATKAASNQSRGVQNVAFQFQDVLVQLEGGTNVFRVIGQQLPQMLVGFGSLGAVIGIAAAGVGVLAGQFFDLTTAQERAAAAQKSFNQVANDTQGLFSESEQAAIKYAQSLSLVEAGALNVAKGEVEKALRDQERAFADASVGIKDQISKLQAQIITAPVEGTDPALDKLFNQIYNELERLKNTPLTIGNIDQAKEQLNALSSAFTQTKLNATPLQDELTKAGRAAFEMNKQTDYLNKVMNRLNELTTLGARFLQMLGFSASDAAGQVSNLTTSVGGLLGRLTEAWSKSGENFAKGSGGMVAELERTAAALDGTKEGNKKAKAEADAVAAGQAAYNKELEETGNLLSALANYQRAYTAQKEIDRKTDKAAAEKPRKGLLEALKEIREEDAKTSDSLIASREAEAKAMDGTVEGNRAAKEEQEAIRFGQEAYNKELNATGNVLKALASYQRAYNAQREVNRKQNDARPAQVSKEQKQQVRQENALDQQTDDIQLNQQLIAAYDQGAAALDRLRAAHDALTSARRLGLKVGTDEHAEYVRQFQDNAEVLREQRRVLSDREKGKQLTDSVATSQEQYNAKMVEYNRLLVNGSINQEAFARLSREAAEANFGYAQGITAIGDAIEQGIMNAESFEDALLKIGLALGKMILQAAVFGSGPLSGLFNALTGTVGGLVGGFAPNVGGGLNLSGPVPSQSTLPKLAGGGDIKPGQGAWVGEHGPEPFFPSVPGTIIPNEALSGGKTIVNHRVTMNINATGDAQVVRAARTAATQAYLQSIKDMPLALQKYNKRVAI